MRESGGTLVRQPLTALASPWDVLTCPFCGASETARLDIEGARFLVFGCMFSPRVDLDLTDAEVAERLRAVVGTDGRQYLRGTCDALHVYVTKGAGARFLTDRDAGASRASHEPTASTQ
jgi:hypothetical protein